jgi:cysteinyl-tRNA synthetase
MGRDLFIYNTLSRRKELFIPITPGFAGIYVCGPTVYGDAHLGHSRPAVTYDVLVRFLRYTGYKVRYVRNITDVGHLENDADSGEDKIAKKARLEQLEPMEVVQHYTLRYHEAMKMLNTLPPDIEPRASGHIIEQIELVRKIMTNGYAYESNGSVYFDVEAYNKKFRYGILSGRTLEEMQLNSRDLDGASDKRSGYDFALWKKASPAHIMRWPSPWGEGFPGWHLECSAMSSKYLGETFDIHGGGMDLLFPHHECEIAQNNASRGTDGIRYWMHNNMVTINGQKMGKSLGNFITLEELFTGSNKSLDQAYSPMTIRFFILQAHYRGTLDFGNEALQASERGLKRLLNASADVSALQITEGTDDNPEIAALYESVMNALSDDLNTPVALSNIFEAVKMVNLAKEKKTGLSENDKIYLNKIVVEIVRDVLGLVGENDSSATSQILTGVINMLLDYRNEAKARKDYVTSDKIRDELNKLGIAIKDTKGGTEWNVI